jgi:hypothetical protein
MHAPAFMEAGAFLRGISRLIPEKSDPLHLAVQQLLI